MARTSSSACCVGRHHRLRAQQWQQPITLELMGLGRPSLVSSSTARNSSRRRRSAATGVRAETCHSKETGTLTLADVRRIIDKADPEDAFLKHDALDEDGVGTTRVQAHATIRVTIPLPPWLSLADDPGATHVTVFRGIPSTLNTPALDPVLNHDGRAPTVQEQARDAIHGHYQNAVEPTTEQLDAIAEFQRTAPQFFSSPAAEEVRQRLDHHLSCPTASRRPSSEDAHSWSMRPSTRLPRRASAPCVMAVRC